MHALSVIKSVCIEVLDDDDPGSRDNFQAIVDPETVLGLVAIVETAERLEDIEEMRSLIRQLAAYVEAVSDDQGHVAQFDRESLVMQARLILDVKPL